MSAGEVKNWSEDISCGPDTPGVDERAGDGFNSRRRLGR